MESSLADWSRDTTPRSQVTVMAEVDSIRVDLHRTLTGSGWVGCWKEGDSATPSSTRPDTPSFAHGCSKKWMAGLSFRFLRKWAHPLRYPHAQWVKDLYFSRAQHFLYFERWYTSSHMTSSPSSSRTCWITSSVLIVR